MKRNQGITIITLVITIIVLLILAGITLNFAFGENGIIKLAEKAKREYENAAKNELSEISQLDNFINNDIGVSGQNGGHEIIYVGNLNKVTGDNGLVTSSFDIKEIYSNYSNLTTENFVYQISRIHCHWNSNPKVQGVTTLVQTYDNETGILTIKNAYGVESFRSGIEGTVYLIPNINNINKDR